MPCSGFCSTWEMGLSCAEPCFGARTEAHTFVLHQEENQCHHITFPVGVTSQGSAVVIPRPGVLQETTELFLKYLEGAPAASPTSLNTARGPQRSWCAGSLCTEPIFLFLSFNSGSEALCRPQIPCGCCERTGAGMRSCLLHPRGRLLGAVATQTWSFPSELPGFPPWMLRVTSCHRGISSSFHAEQQQP